MLVTAGRLRDDRSWAGMRRQLGVALKGLQWMHWHSPRTIVVRRTFNEVMVQTRVCSPSMQAHPSSFKTSRCHNQYPT